MTLNFRFFSLKFQYPTEPGVSICSCRGWSYFGGVVVWYVYVIRRGRNGQPQQGDDKYPEKERGEYTVLIYSLRAGISLFPSPGATKSRNHKSASRSHIAAIRRDDPVRIFVNWINTDKPAEIRRYQSRRWTEFATMFTRTRRRLASRRLAF